MRGVVYDANDVVHELNAVVHVWMGISMNVHTSAAFLNGTQDDGTEVGH